MSKLPPIGPFPSIPPTNPYMKHRLGGWLPHDPKVFLAWVKRAVEHVEKKHRVARRAKHESIQAFWKLVDTNTQVRMQFDLMWKQVPVKEPYLTDPTGQWYIHDKPGYPAYEQMLDIFDWLLDQGPIWLYNTAGQQGLVGFPFNAILDWPMGTAAGVSVFLRDDVNKCFRDMLYEYQAFLASSASTAVLSKDPEGWFSPQALQAMGQVASEGYGKPLTFEQAFVCNSSAPAYGYTSWDDFFTRSWNEGIRPIYQPTDSTYINNACESTPYALQTKVQLRDSFWAKGQPYSLADMLGNADTAAPFVNGTVYQAFLSALSYHKWHAPVTGTVKALTYLPGTYYAESYWEGFANIDPETGLPNPDPSAPNDSQGYISAIATRAVMVIAADDDRIGDMAMVTIGMAEVSSCQWDASLQVGSTITKGQEIGTFHFGGSTHCLIFKPGVELDFVVKPPFTGDEKNLPVCGLLATVKNGPLKKAC